MHRHRALSFCLVAVLLCGNAHAADDWSLYWGAGGATVLPQGAGNRMGLNASGRFGLQYAGFPGFAAEADLTTSIVKGHYSNRDLKLTTLGGYLAWRSSGRWYLKVRGGGVWEWTKVGGGSANDGGLSGGIGGGYRFDDGRSLELEFTVIEKNVDMLSLTYQF
jgi:hypothetical protein